MNNTVKTANRPAPARAKAAPVKKKSKRASLDARKARSGWLFLLPFLAGLFFIYAPIVIDSIKFSFGSVKTMPGGGFQYTFVGFANYVEAVTVDANFTRILTSGIKDLIFDIPAIVIFSLFMVKNLLALFSIWVHYTPLCQGLSTNNEYLFTFC